VDWSRDGSKFAVGGDFSSRVNIFSASGQKEAEIKLPGGWVWSLAWSDDYLAVSNDAASTIYIYDANDYSLVQELRHGGNPAGELDFSPDGSLLISCHRDPKMNIWETANWTIRASFDAHPKVGREQGCIGGAFSHDGDVYFTSGDEGNVIAWDTDSGDLLTQFRYGVIVWGVSVSGDGHLLAAVVGDGTLHILGLRAP